MRLTNTSNKGYDDYRNGSLRKKRVMKNFDQAYCTMKDLIHQRGGDTICIFFANGDEAEITSSREQLGIDWDTLGIAEDGTHLVATFPGGVTEIGWDAIRRLSDPTFKEVYDKMALNQRQFIGLRIKQYRETHDLDVEALAIRTGLDAADITALEEGMLIDNWPMKCLFITGILEVKLE